MRHWWSSSQNDAAKVVPRPYREEPRDLFAHTVTQAGGLFDSKELKPGATWTWAAGTSGTFPYVCAFHPTMKGKLVVR
jgi:plastocyanin